ncbi:hypothetical protein NON20_23020 [Synechocystis sp. B12]|nr:hypothetical protein NON20_23020 [Synechocystis sp. B12]
MRGIAATGVLGLTPMVSPPDWQIHTKPRRWCSVALIFVFLITSALF